MRSHETQHTVCDCSMFYLCNISTLYVNAVHDIYILVLISTNDLRVTFCLTIFAINKALIFCTKRIELSFPQKALVHIFLRIRIHLDLQYIMGCYEM